MKTLNLTESQYQGLSEVYANIQYDGGDLHASYYSAEYRGERYELKITEDGELYDRVEGSEDWNYVDQM
jgi:hypothetical protein